MMKSGTVKVAAVMSLMLAGISVAAAQSGGSGGSGASGSAGATIDTGAGGALAGASPSNNPGVAFIPGGTLTGPVGLVVEVFSESAGRDSDT